MIRMVWSRLFHRKMATIAMLAALISVYTLIPFGLFQAKEAKSTVNHSIEQYGRGTYDLLVRPASSRTQVEKKLGIVEENYIGDSKGGISIEEWRRIKADSMIEVAAPVASLGYFRGKRLSLELPVLKNPTRFTYQFYTSDGYKKYPIGQPGMLTYFEQSRPGMIQYIVNPSTQSHFSSIAMMILMPDNYYLLTAIDPESEQQLTGIDFSELKKPLELDNNQDPRAVALKAMLKNYGNPPIVKVLQRDNLNIPIFLRLKADTLHVSTEDYLRKLHLQKGQWLMEAQPEQVTSALKELEKEPATQSKTIDLDLSKLQKPFDGTALLLNDQWQPSISQRYMADSDTSVYYVASKIAYHRLDSIPKVNVVQSGEPPSYKKIEKRGVSMLTSFKIPFFIEQVGTFSPKTGSHSKLAASPLGIYGEMEAKTENGRTLTPTTIPGSFIPAPASGVTTLESAELIKGKKPIDAIRIRVAGIKKYDEAARQKIEKVATKLLRQGYEVDVVAGASFKEMTLDVEKIGKVKEPWTTLGIAQQLTYKWNHMNLLTTVLFTLFAMLWLAMRLTFEKNVLVLENEWLALIGWREQHIRNRNCIEQYVLMTVAFVVSLGILYLLDMALPLYGLAAGLWAFSLILATYLLQRREKGTPQIVADQRFASLRYYRRWIVPTSGILLLSTVLMAVQVSALASALQTTAVTTLGEYVRDVTFWFQISVIVSSAYLAVIGVSEGINTLLRERKSEFQMYRMIGWTRNTVLWHFAKEIVIWALSAMVLGLGLAGTVLYLLHISLIWITIGLSSVFFVLALMIVAIVCTRRLETV
ncbi:FtsX-like permease family protein [Anoxybacteroides tepidamans]|uniref:FtsX-like permease family protein n=1 Tax=Anoxybacteroides tepidamans TaxID=265948 RepID=UPI000489181E|nr:ABC transporter permease [Anoxybacillus tepidamans]